MAPLSKDEMGKSIKEWWEDFYQTRVPDHAGLSQPLTWLASRAIPEHNEWIIACVVHSLGSESAWIASLAQALNRPVPDRSKEHEPLTPLLAKAIVGGRGDLRNALSDFYAKLLWKLKPAAGTNPPTRGDGFQVVRRACENFIASQAKPVRESSGTSFYSQAASQTEGWLRDLNGALDGLREVVNNAKQANTLATLDELFARAIASGTVGLEAQQRIVRIWHDGDAAVREMLAKATSKLVDSVDDCGNYKDEDLGNAVQFFTGVLADAERCANAWFDCCYGLKGPTGDTYATKVPSSKALPEHLPALIEWIETSLKAIADARRRIAEAAMAELTPSTTVAPPLSPAAGRKDPVPPEPRWKFLSK